jgi:hypothetical protein
VNACDALVPVETAVIVIVVPGVIHGFASQNVVVNRPEPSVVPSAEAKFESGGPVKETTCPGSTAPASERTVTVTATGPVAGMTPPAASIAICGRTEVFADAGDWLRRVTAGTAKTPAATTERRERPAPVGDAVGGDSRIEETELMSAMRGCSRV